MRDPHCTRHSTYCWWQRLIDWDVIFVFQIFKKWFYPILDSNHLHNKLSESGQNLCMSPVKARMWRRDRCEDDQRSELYSCTLSTSGTIGQFDLNLENSHWIVNPVIRRLNKSLLTNAHSVFRQNNYIEMTADFKAKKLTEIVPETEVAVETKVEYKVYSERWADIRDPRYLRLQLNSCCNCRWWILGTVVLLNFANYAHWIAFPAVAKKVMGNALVNAE